MTANQWLALLGSQLLLWVLAVLFLLPLRRQPRAAARGAMCIVGAVGARAALALAAGWQVQFWVGPAVSFLFVLGLFRFCAFLSVKGAVFCGIWSMILAQLAGQGGHLGFAAASQALPTAAAAALGLLLLAAFCGVVGLTMARWMPEDGGYDIGPRQFSSALFLFALFEVLVAALNIVWRQDPVWEGWPLILLLEAYGATLLYFQHEMFKKSALRQELALLNRLHAQQRAQYDLAKENIALINRKCHDLKHQIKAMRLMFQDENREKYLQEIEQAVRIYGAIAKTGNEVLDTVLTEKSLYCEAHSIQAHCVADGSLLDFMDPVDLYTIFANALDNAIEGVKDLRETQRRFIDVLVHRENQLLVIQVLNPIEAEPQFDQNGLPVTTKAKDGYHGFGLKSIRHTVEQYGGFLSVSVENGCFCLRLLLPLEPAGRGGAAS